MRRHRTSQEGRRRGQALEEKLSALWKAMTPEQREVLVAMAQLQKTHQTANWVAILRQLEMLHTNWHKDVIAVLARLRQNFDAVERERPDPLFLEWPIPK
jgi:hypothetical protein